MEPAIQKNKCDNDVKPNMISKFLIFKKVVN